MAGVQDVTVRTSDDPDEVIDLLREVHEEHRHRLPDRFKPFDRTAALEAQRLLVSRAGAQMIVARVEGVCVGYALVCERIREENPFRYASRSLVVDQMAVSNAHRRQGFGSLLMDRVRSEAARRGMQRVELKVYSDNDNARLFYKAHDFVRFQDFMEWSPLRLLFRRGVG